MLGPTPVLRRETLSRMGEAHSQGLVARRSIGWGTASSLRLWGCTEETGVIWFPGESSLGWDGPCRTLGPRAPAQAAGTSPHRGCSDFLLSGDFSASGFVRVFVYCALLLRDKALIKRSRQVRRTLSSRLPSTSGGVMPLARERLI